MCAQQNNSNSLYTDIASAYWNEICNTEPLSLDEQKSLLTKAKTGDNIARDKLVESFLRLVVSRAKIYCHDFDSFMDMVQEGNIGLLAAVEGFDPEKGCRFSTYATQWIDRYIRRESFRTGKPTRVPERLKTEINRLTTAETLFAQQNNRFPNSFEIAEMLDTSVEKVNQLKAILKSSLSLNTAIEPEDPASNSLTSLLPDPNTATPEEIICSSFTKNVLLDLMKQTLTENEYLILKLRFGIDGSPQTLLAISKSIGITKEGVRKAENRAISKLQRAIFNSGLTEIDFV